MNGIKIKSIISLFALCALASSSLAAFEWGGLVTNDSTYKGQSDDMHIRQSDKLTMWIKVPLPGSKDSYFTAESFYTFKYESKKDDISHIFDVNLCKLSLSNQLNNATTIFNIGRYGLRDLSGLIVNQNADGMELAVKTKNVSVSAYAGFTGLLNAHTQQMNVIATTANAAPVYTKTAPMVLGKLTCTFPRLFAQQTNAYELYGAVNAIEKRLYATMALNGPIYKNLFYLFSATGSLRQTYDSKFAFSNLSRLEISAYLPFYSSLVSWNTVFATGKTKYTTSFEPLTVSSANTSSSLEYAGNFKTGLTASIRPIDSLLFACSADTFFNVMNARQAKGFIGAQWHMAWRWQIVSDIQIAASVSQFFAVSDEQKRNPYTSASLKLIYSF